MESNEGAASPAVEGAFRLLNLLAMAPRGLRLSNLVVKSGLPKTTVHRLLHTLARLEVVHRDEATKHYHLGPALGRLVRPDTQPFSPNKVPTHQKPCGCNGNGGGDTHPTLPPNLSHFSAPVVGRDGHAVASITMYVPGPRLPHAAAQRFTQVVIAAATDIAEKITK